jgi:hypothetical protein
MRFHPWILAAVLAATGTVTAWAAAPPLYEFTFDGPDSSGRVVYSVVPDRDPDGHKGRYIGAVQSYTIQLNGTVQSETGLPVTETFQGSVGSLILGFQADGIGACGFASDCLSFVFDTLHFPAWPNDPFVNIQFDYPVGTFTDDGLPTSLAPVAGQSIFMSGNRQWFLDHPLTQIAAVPDAPSLALLLAGLAVLGTAALRRPRPHTHPTRRHT